MWHHFGPPLEPVGHPSTHFTGIAEILKTISGHLGPILEPQQSSGRWTPFRSLRESQNSYPRQTNLYWALLPVGIRLGIRFGVRFGIRFGVRVGVRFGVRFSNKRSLGLSDLVADCLSDLGGDLVSGFGAAQKSESGGLSENASESGSGLAPTSTSESTAAHGAKHNLISTLICFWIRMVMIYKAPAKATNQT